MPGGTVEGRWIIAGTLTTATYPCMCAIENYRCKRKYCPCWRRPDGDTADLPPGCCGMRPRHTPPKESP